MTWRDPMTTRRHFRTLRERLEAEGFTIEGARYGKHLRVRVSKGGHAGTVTCSGSPQVPEVAVERTMQLARAVARGQRADTRRS